MFSGLIKGVLVAVIGALFLIAMLGALCADLIARDSPRRRVQTPSGRNPGALLEVERAVVVNNAEGMPT